MDKAQLATIISFPIIAISSYIAIHYDSIANSVNWKIGEHNISYAFFPELVMIGAVSYWVSALFNWKLGLIVGLTFLGILFLETQTYIGNWFWSLF